MAPTLYGGDRILVSKTVPGARLFNFFTTSEGQELTIRRLPGYRKIQRNDIIVFNFPHSGTWDRLEMNLSKYYVKRCIGLPGDTLSIENGFYKIHGDSVVVGNLRSQENLSGIQDTFIEEEVWRCFPYDSIIDWNIKNWGPLFIPRAGDTVELTRTNYILYKKIIEWEQKKDIVWFDNTCLLQGNPVYYYTFTHNYYFMGGDRVEDSQDSRYWGLLPEEYIVGKAFLVWMSVDLYTGEYEWRRFFKRIH